MVPGWVDELTSVLERGNNALGVRRLDSESPWLDPRESVPERVVVEAASVLTAGRTRDVELAVRRALAARGERVGSSRAAVVVEPGERWADMTDEIFAWLAGGTEAVSWTDASHRDMDETGGGVPDRWQRLAATRWEDVCLLAQVDGRWVLIGGLLAHGSQWSLPDKVGASLVDVHSPVPGYRENLSDRVDRFVDRLAPGRVAIRRNLMVVTSSMLHLPRSGDAGTVPENGVAPDGHPLWLRSEWQTMSRLSDSGGLVFTIHVQVAPAAVLLRRPQLAALLADEVRSWSPAAAAYKLQGADRFATWLDTVARPTM